MSFISKIQQIFCNELILARFTAFWKFGFEKCVLDVNISMIEGFCHCYMSQVCQALREQVSSFKKTVLGKTSLTITVDSCIF